MTQTEKKENETSFHFSSQNTTQTRRIYQQIFLFLRHFVKFVKPIFSYQNILIYLAPEKVIMPFEFEFLIDDFKTRKHRLSANLKEQVPIFLLIYFVK